MRKGIKVISILMGMVLLISSMLIGCDKESEMREVRLNEVVHSIFYAPQYVALEKGFFEEEGLAIELSTGWGADKSMTALLSDNADIALMGPEASIYVFNEGQEDYAINFALLTQRAGNFLMAREPMNDFTWDDVRGKSIVGGRRGGMPQMVLEYILRENGIEPFEDVEIITNIDFSATAGAFLGGTGDYSVEFEPTASLIEQQGVSVVASLGVESGKVPYTGYMATKSYMKENEDIIQDFTNAIYKAQIWVEEHTSKEIAEVILPYFEDTELDLLTVIVERYKSQETWRQDPLFEKESLALLQDVLESAGELNKHVEYKDIVETSFAEKAKDSID